MAKKPKDTEPFITIQIKGKQASGKGVFMKWISSYMASHGFGVTEDEKTFSVHVNDLLSVKVFHISEVIQLDEKMNKAANKAKKTAKKGAK